MQECVCFSVLFTCGGWREVKGRESLERRMSCGRCVITSLVSDCRHLCSITIKWDKTVLVLLLLNIQNLD